MRVNQPHPHHHHLPHGSRATKNVLVAFVLNLSFTFLEVFGAFWTGSVAIWADAIHDFGDSLMLGLALLMQKFSERKPDSRFTYGYARFSLLSALLTGVVLCLGSLGIFYHSLPRFFHPKPPETGGMLILAVFGIAVNGAAFFRLKRGQTQNEKILSWHLFEDFAGWIAVMIGALLIRWFRIYWIDPLLACVLALIILWNAFLNLKTTSFLLLQRTPQDFKTEEFIARVMSTTGACGVHDLHVWSLDGDLSIMSFHLVLNPGITKVEEIAAVKALARETAEQFGHFHVTIEVEHSSEVCEMKEGETAASHDHE
jgi:cobalt-zinc-cadmium efflux system protein